MSEANDGGLAERGGGGVASPGGPNTASGGDNRPGRSGDRSGSGTSKSDKAAGVNKTAAKKKSNIKNTYGELLPGVRAPVVPGFQYTNRKNQTLGDIQTQNALGNAAAMGANPGSAQGGAAGTVYNPLKRLTVYDPVIKKYVPIPQPKPQPPVNPVTGLPMAPPPQQVPPLDLTANPLTAPPKSINYGVPAPAPAPAPYAGYTGPLPGGMMSPEDIDQGTMNDWANSGTGTGMPWGGGQVTGNDSFGDLGNNYPGGGQNTSVSVGNRQFGGPVAPGQQYTVGENGPETLQMGANGGGQVIPHNPMDRLGSMSPQMMQQMFQLRRQFGGQRPPMQPPPQRPQMPPQQMGQQQPPVQGGFGLSNLGQPGVLGQLRNRPGFGGRIG